MSHPAFIDIADGALRSAIWSGGHGSSSRQATAVQPASFELRDDTARPANARPRGAIRNRRCSTCWRRRADRPALPD
jgi:hypothetical protein